MIRPSIVRVAVPAVLAMLAAGTAAAKPDAPAKPEAKKADPKPDSKKTDGATGKLNREEFENALKAVLPDMHVCYDKALKKDAIAEGQVVLVLETQNGKVLKADTDREVSSLKLEDAHKCIVSVAKKIKMPLAKNADGKHDPKAKAVVRYPLEFSLGIDVGAGIAKSTGAKLDHDKVKSLFFVNKIEIGRCYLDAYKAKKGVAASGKLVLKIGVTGGKATSVDEVAPDTTVEDKELKSCVADAVKKFKFPLPKDAKGNDDEKAASVIVYPMEFQSR